MKKVLYISYFAPYDKVDHAGGKVHNFYVKKMQQEPELDITLLTMCYQREVEKLDLEQYGIDHRLVVLDKNPIQKLWRMFYSGFSYFNPWDAYNGVLLNYERHCLKKMIRQYATKHAAPDMIILQWTQIILLMPYIRKWYPTVPIVAIEEDVLFLNFYRRIGLSQDRLHRQIAQYQYNNMKTKELQALQAAQLVVTNNPKDGRLLLENQIDKNRLFVSSVYFENYGQIVRKPKAKELLFYGAMHREENHRSVMWLIEEVMPLLPKEYHLTVVGARPYRELLDAQNERITVTGFVEQVTPYFEECLCLVAPLVLGAGIKVKVLEAMSAAIPVLTNEIGIEGIGAEDGKEYYHCVSAKDYAKCIVELGENPQLVTSMGKAAKQYVREHFDLERKYQELLVRMQQLDS